MSNDSNNTVKYVAVGCAAILAFVCCCCGGFGAFIYGAGAGPRDAGQAFFADLRTGHYDAARERMSEGYRASHDVPTFTAAVSALPALVHQTDATFTSMNVQNTTATLGGVLTTPQGNVPVEMTMTLVGTSWFIDTVRIGGQPLQ